MKSIRTNEDESYDHELRFFTQKGTDGKFDRMTIKHDGNVGINTTSPSKKLQINFGSAVNGAGVNNDGIILFNTSSAGGTHLGGIHFRRYDNDGTGTSNEKTFALIDAQTSDSTAGSEDGHIRFSTILL